MKSYMWKTLSVAASTILLIGFVGVASSSAKPKPGKGKGKKPAKTKPVKVKPKKVMPVKGKPMKLKPVKVKTKPKKAKKPKGTKGPKGPKVKIGHPGLALGHSPTKELDKHFLRLAKIAWLEQLFLTKGDDRRVDRCRKMRALEMKRHKKAMIRIKKGRVKVKVK